MGNTILAAWGVVAAAVVVIVVAGWAIYAIYKVLSRGFYLD